MAVEQADKRHRSNRRERSPVASSRAKNELGRGHHGDPANALRQHEDLWMNYFKAKKQYTSGIVEG